MIIGEGEDICIKNGDDWGVVEKFEKNGWKKEIGKKEKKS